MGSKKFIIRLYCMKYLLFAISALFLDMIGSCRHVEPVYLEVNPNTVMLDSRSSSATIEVKSNTQWSVSVSGESWLVVSPLSGTCDAEIIVTARTNESTYDRSSTILVVGEDMQQQVRVYQQGKAGD